MAGIQVQEHGTVTLASTRGELTVVVSSLNDYPIKAYSTSRTPPSVPEATGARWWSTPGQPLQVRRGDQPQGSFLLDIVLSGEDDLEISRSTVNLRTSSLNTLALTFLAILLGALLLACSCADAPLGRRGKHELD